MSVRPGHIRWIVFGLALLFSLPFFPAPLEGVYLWASPYILLNSLLSGNSLAWLHLSGLVFLVTIIFRKRWICRYACPTGVICDLSSKHGRKTKAGWKFPLNKYLLVFSLVLALFGIPLLNVVDPYNLFFMAFEGFRSGLGLHAVLKLCGLLFLIVFSLLLPHVWCASVCPLGGLQLLLSELRHFFKSPQINPGTGQTSRRYFLTGFAGILGGLAVPRIIPVRKGEVIRPPFTLPEGELNLVCIRCGNCAAVCPTGIIRQSSDLQRPERLLTPIVCYKDSYCLPECTGCGQVCPSGAIQKFSLEDKAQYIMGTAVIQTDQCYLQQGRECNLCRQYCEYDAILMKETTEDGTRLPAVMENNCVGCGACKIICPPRAIEIRTLEKSLI